MKLVDTVKNASVMTYIRIRLRLVLWRSPFAAVKDLQAKWNDVNLYDLTDIDFSLIPRPIILYKEIADNYVGVMTLT